MNPDLETAIKNLRAAALRYDKPDRYYRGDHDLAFATEKFENAFGDLFREFALNLCPAICDAVRDKLKVTGFSIGGARTLAGAPAAASADGVALSASVARDAAGIRSPHASKGSTSHTLEAELEDKKPEMRHLQLAIESLWYSNHMDITQEEVHLEALKVGDSYAIVWPDAGGSVTIYPQHAANCTVHYDDEMPGRMLWAAKYWRASNGFVRLNLFYPDRIEKYISRTRCELALPDAREFMPLIAPLLPEEGWRRFADGVVGANGDAVEPNPYGEIPLFHFSNTSEIGSFGRSELAQAIPIQNGLNKSVLDMLVAMEFSAFRQRWATGLEVEYGTDGTAIPPFKIGMDRLWLSTNPQTSFGDFNTTDLDQFLKVKDSFRVDMASVTGTPIHYFLQNIRGFASGEALGRAEARFLAKVRDRQRSFGVSWSRLMSFALQVAGFDKGVSLRTQWEDPAPVAERDFLENLILKKQLGLSTEQVLLEAGYGRADITRMLRSADTPVRKRRSRRQEPPAVAGG